MSMWRRELLARLQSLKLRPEREAEIVEELSQHLDDRVRELEAGGAPAGEARRAALEDLDSPGALARKLAEIEARPPLRLPPPGQPMRGRWLAAVWQDVRHAAASLRRTPGFALTVVGALALTIGPTTAIISVANWLIWRPPPGVVDPDRLAVLWFGEWREVDGGVGVSPHGVSESNLSDLREASETIAGIAGWQETSASLAIEGMPPRRVEIGHSTAGFFDLLGVRPVSGRGPAPEEDVPPFGAPVAVISHGLARQALGGADAALTRSIRLNGRPLTVIGVMPAGFVGASPVSGVDVWIPSWTYYYVNHFSESSMTRRVGRGDGAFYTFIVRLAPEVTFDRLRAELDVLVPALAAQHPDENEAFTTVRARVFPGLGVHELQRDRYAGLVRNLLLVGGVLLLLGCANVANLLMSRGVRRRHERAVRVALGASRARLAQLLLTESCLLAVAGASLGVALAFWLKDVIQALLLPGLAGSGVDVAVPLDVRVLLATLGVAVGCGLLAGLVPAWVGSSAGPSSDMGRGGLRASARGSRLRTGFAALQLALSLALVTNALLLVGTVRNLAGVDVGFDPVGVSIHEVAPSTHGYDPAQSMAYDRALLDRLSADPAVDAVSLSSSYPFGSGYSNTIADPGGSGGATIDVYQNFVSADYFRVLGIRMVHGRGFDDAEAMLSASPDGSPVILDGLLARRLFGDTNPIGRRVRFPATSAVPEHDRTVVGVTADTRRSSLTDMPDLLMYLPFVQGGAYAATRPDVLVKSRLPLHEVGDLVQSHASAIDPTLPFYPPRPLSAAIARHVADQNVLATVLSLLGALGFVLAALGLYGLLAQLVGERTRELGIRTALGASRGRVFALVLRQAAWIAVAGGAAGLLLAWWGTGAIEAELVGVTPLEPEIYIASLAALTAVVLVAAAWPARAATRIQPVEALRTE